MDARQAENKVFVCFFFYLFIEFTWCPEPLSLQVVHLESGEEEEEEQINKLLHSPGLGLHDSAFHNFSCDCSIIVCHGRTSAAVHESDPGSRGSEMDDVVTANAIVG